MRKMKILLLLVVVFNLILMITGFILKKSDMYFESSNYIFRYLMLFADDVLGSSLDDLIISNRFNFYVKPGLENLLSSAMIYTLPFQTVFIDILTFLSPFLIYYFISNRFYSEFHGKLKNVISMKIGTIKYVYKVFFTSSLIGLSIFLLPRLIYLGLVLIFFPNGYSEFNFEYSLFIEEGFKLSEILINNPYHVLFLDLLISVCGGLFFSALSIVIVSMNKSVVRGYAWFAIIISFQVILYFLIIAFFDDIRDIVTPWILMYSYFNFIGLINIQYLVIHVVKLLLLSIAGYLIVFMRLKANYDII